MRINEMQLIQHNNQTNTILFISGMFAGRWMWRDMQRKLGSSSSLMIAQALGEIGSSVSTFTEILTQKIANIETPISIAGNSLGGYVALDLARQNPEKIDKVIISGAAGFSEINLGLKLSRTNYDFINQLVDLIFFDSEVISDEDKNSIADVFRNNMRNVIGLIKESNRANAEEVIRNVKCPIYAIWGQEDRITPLSDALPLLQASNARVEVIPQCGHSPMYEKPNEFTDWFKHCLIS